MITVQRMKICSSELAANDLLRREFCVNNPVGALQTSAGSDARDATSLRTRAESARGETRLPIVTYKVTIYLRRVWLCFCLFAFALPGALPCPQTTHSHKAYEIKYSEWV
ncbi:hypothetical protein EVAR_97581_1 [Eumeta japonica]|uniref:Uncharacterized protein n=1 Tax=Eumeta variegata TaxID=151549 RepID=A0A4C1WNC9_EUMVA|nr:hypothetical protein EVAR_97581_1 [Eumeta japonica]